MFNAAAFDAMKPGAVLLNDTRGELVAHPALVAALESGRLGGAGPGPEGRNMDHFCLTIEPFDEAALRAHLADHGIAAGAVKKRYGAEGEGPSLYITDPDGNTVELKGPPFKRGG